MNVIALSIALLAAATPARVSVDKISNQASLKPQAIELLEERLHEAVLGAAKSGRCELVAKDGDVTLQSKATSLDNKVFLTLKAVKKEGAEVLASRTVDGANSAELVERVGEAAKQLLTEAFGAPLAQAPTVAIANDAASTDEQLRSACETGDGIACGKVGRRIYKAKPGKDGAAEAAGWYQKGCDKGADIVCGVLAEAMTKGEVPAATSKDAIPLFKKACEGKDSGSCILLGDLVRDSDPDRALRDYEFACNFDSGLGCNRAGWMREQMAPRPSLQHFDLLAPRKRQEALAVAAQRFNRACQLKDPDGCYNLGRYYESGSGVIQDLNQAEYHYRRSCELREGPACGDQSRLRRQLDAASHTINVNLNQ